MTAALLLVAAGSGDAAALLKGSFRGNAYGTFANARAGDVATTLGRSAYQVCPCNGTGGKTLTNTITNLSAGENGQVLKAGEVRSTVYTNKTSTSAVNRESATVSNLNAFDGLITAGAVKAAANTSADPRNIRASIQGTTLLNLRVAGRLIRADVAPNTRVALPGIGTVTLKKVSQGGNNQTRSITVDAITVDVTRSNDFGLPIGTQIIIGHATSGFSRTEPTVIVGGSAYAATANERIGSTLANRIGRAAAVYMGCEGTRGKTLTNNIESTRVGPTITTGTGRTTAFGGPTASGTVARTTATVETANLLGGRITADAIRVVANDRFSNGRRFSSTEGTRFVNLKVLGVPVAVNTPPNTRLSLPGIGYVIVNQQNVPAPTSRDLLSVNGLHVFVTQRNSLGLPVGSQIIVAHAQSSAVRF